jgi:hypothetical protein
LVHCFAGVSRRYMINCCHFSWQWWWFSVFFYLN